MLTPWRSQGLTTSAINTCYDLPMTVLIGYLIAFMLPGFVLGLIFGRWGVYVSIGLFVLYTLLGLIVFSANTVDERTQFNLSKAWTYSIFWIVGALIAQLI